MTIDDPENYRKLNVPFDTVEKMDEAVELFTSQVKTLRDNFAIANVYLIIHTRAKNERGQEGEQVLTAHFGDTSLSERLTAIAFGAEKRKHDQSIAKALGSAEKKKRGKKP